VKVPPFRSAPAAMLRDYTTQEGAYVLAGMISAAWTKAGHDVRVDVVPVQPGHPNTSWTVRMPTLVNGLPK
jgi:hypothetical protein